MALKSQPVALAIIQGHLHGYRGHQWWRSQAHMDRDLPEIVATWKQTVHGLYWPSPADSDHWLTCTGFPPENWRTALFEEISLPGFCATLLHKVKHQLHGRFQLDLRRQISDATRQRETLLVHRPAAPSEPGTWTRTTDDLGHQPPWTTCVETRGLHPCTTAGVTACAIVLVVSCLHCLCSCKLFAE